MESMQNEIDRLKLSTDLSYLKEELKSTNARMPECAAESFFRMSKMSAIVHRIKELEQIKN